MWQQQEELYMLKKKHSFRFQTNENQNNGKAPSKRKLVEIGLRFRIDQLASIDTVDQTYHALCSLDMDWLASENDIINHAKDPRYILMEQCFFLRVSVTCTP